MDAARTRFMAEGYTRTSVRAVARDAGVDHALVNYYFGSKQGLFGHVMALTLSPGRVLDAVARRGGPDIPEAVLATMLAVWDDPRYQEPLLTMMDEAATVPEVREAVAGYLGREVFARVAELSGGRASREHAAGAAAVLSGVVLARYLVRVEPLASMSSQEVVRAVAPALRAALGLPAARREPRRQA